MESAESARGESLYLGILSVTFALEQDTNVPTQEILESPLLHTFLVCQFQSFGCSELVWQLVKDSELLRSKRFLIHDSLNIKGCHSKILRKQDRFLHGFLVNAIFSYLSASQKRMR